MFKLFVVYLFCLFCLFFQACGALFTSDGEDESSFADDKNNEDIIMVVSDSSLLGSRMTVINEKLEVFVDVESSAALTKKTKVEPEFTLTLIADLEPPVVNGVTLQATDVVTKGKMVYLSYNVAKGEKSGAIDHVNVKKASDPLLISQIIFENRDINSLSLQSNDLYFSGSWNQETTSFVSSVRLKSNQLTDEIVDKPLSGFSGTDIFATSKKIFVTTGDNGGLYILDHDFEQEGYVAYYDARSVYEDKSKDGPWLLTGQPGTLINLDDENEVEVEYALGGASIAESKSTLQVEKNWSLSTIGEGGFVAVCSETGEVLKEVSPPEIERESDEISVTNAAFAVSKYIFTANGEEGVHVYEMPKNVKSKCKDFGATYLGYIDFGEDLSANHIAYRGDYIFVADGLGGFKIIEIDFIEVDDDDD